MFEDQIDYEFVKRDFEFCVGYGNAMMMENTPNTVDEFDRTLTAATYFHRAAEQGVLLGIGNYNYLSVEWVNVVRQLIATAAMQYVRWGSPYSIMLMRVARINLTNMASYTVISNYFLDEYFQDHKSYIVVRPAKMIQYVYVLMAGEFAQSAEVREQLEPLRHHRIGVLSISIHQILNVLDAISGRKDAVPEAMMPILMLYDEALQTAMLNRYHFRRLLMSFHPVNFEVICLLLRVGKQSAAINLVEQSPISVVSKQFLIRLLSRLSNID